MRAMGFLAGKKETRKKPWKWCQRSEASSGEIRIAACVLPEKLLEAQSEIVRWEIEDELSEEIRQRTLVQWNGQKKSYVNLCHREKKTRLVDRCPENECLAFNLEQAERWHNLTRSSPEIERWHRWLERSVEPRVDRKWGHFSGLKNKKLEISWNETK